MIKNTYIPQSLSKKDTKKQRKMILNSRKNYRMGERNRKYVTRDKLVSFKSKKSGWVSKATDFYNVYTLVVNKKLSRSTGCSVNGLNKIIKKGQGAYYSSGSRPNQTAHSWGVARLGSSIMGGPASNVDYHILKDHCKKNSRALKLADRFKSKKKGGERMIKDKEVNKVKPIKKKGVIFFSDHPEFSPNLTPKEIFEFGSFGGTYWRPIYSNITEKNYSNVHKKYPKKWWENLEDIHLTSKKYNKKLNKYGVKVGTSLKFWEEKDWIKKNNPYGWMHWYCDFYIGKRGNDDKRQIKRWRDFSGEKGRFRLWLITLIKKKNSTYDDDQISPKIRQSLQHWGYVLTEKDFNSSS